MSVLPSRVFSVTMRNRAGVLLGALMAVCVSACSSGAGRRPVQVAPSAPPAAQAAPATAAPASVDPIQELLATADRHFEEGRAELTMGHLARAKAGFNRALEVLLESPQGARTDA